MIKRHIIVTVALAAILAAAALASATAQAGAPRVLAGAAVASAEGPPPVCIVHSLPAFTAQGEFATTGTVADIIEVECNPEIYGTKAPIRITADQLYLRCERSVTWYVPNSPAGPTDGLQGSNGPEKSGGFQRSSGNGVTLELDPDGNATVALRAGPNCTAGESLVTAHMQRYPYESFTTSFSVLPPQSTPQGVRTMPASQVVDAYSSAFATIIQAEFPGISEEKARIGSEELYHRCHLAPHLRWIGIDGSETTEVPEVSGVPIDNAGNGFVIVIGDSSCAPGGSLIEADLEERPFTTLTTTFADEPPQPTAEPAFTIEKQQQIHGSATGFTTSPLRATRGETIDYQIIVKNTAAVPETLSELTDRNCDPGTLTGEGGSLAPGASATYTCRHLLSVVGSYVNEATATANTVGGAPLTRTSNQVLVEVPAAPGFSIEKRQRVAGSGGSFSTAQLSASGGQTVEYQIVVTNTGNQPLMLSGFSDPHCDAATIAGGPGAAALALGASTTYTCSHALSAAGSYVNVASIVATPPGEAPISHSSNPVTVEVPAPSPPQKEKEKPKVVVKCFKATGGSILHGASGARRGPFTVKVGSVGIERIIFWLDKHRLAILGSAQAKNNKFAIRIDPRRLSFGAHRLMARITTNRECPSSRVSSSFVRAPQPAPPTG